MSQQNSDFTDEQKEVLHSIRVSRVILPILIGVGVVGYLLYQQFNPDEFAKIQWTQHTAFWIGLSVVKECKKYSGLSILLFGSGYL